MRAIVVLNAAAGVRPREVGDEIARIGDAFGSSGMEAEVRPTTGPRLTEAARAAAEAGADMVVLAGGDGTMSAGAAALAGSGKPMGVLPLGTLNHFARDLGISLDLEEAVRTVAAGYVREVDVGTANDRVFLNNSSIGLYPTAVQDREAQRARDGTGKWVAMWGAALKTLRHFPVARVTLSLTGGTLRVMTPMLFIGNNRYEMSLFSMGKRETIDEGQLWLYVARDTGRFGFVRLILRAVAGRLDQSRDFLSRGVEELSVEDRRHTIAVALDGEVCRMASPIRYRVRPRALRVVAPAP